MSKSNKGGGRVSKREPSAKSLKEIPELDFSKANVCRNPYASRAAKSVTIKTGKCEDLTRRDKKMRERCSEERVTETVRDLSTDATGDNATERQDFLAKVERGLLESERDQTIAHDKIRRRFGASTKPVTGRKKKQ